MPLGTFVIINPSLNHGPEGISLSLQLKDKMCLLSGECGGVIPASTQFDEYETIDEHGQYVIDRPVILQIITEAVNHFGGEQLGKIIISDVDTKIKQTMKWIGSTPLYFLNTVGEFKFTTNYSEVDGNACRCISKFSCLPESLFFRLHGSCFIQCVYWNFTGSWR